MALEFIWDPRKAASNLKKHGVGFPEAITAFTDQYCAVIPDPSHSLEEERFLLVGTSARNRLVVVAHAERGPQIRIISARLATRTERQRYEEKD